MTYDDAGHYQVPGDDFDTVLEIFRHDRNGKSRREVAERSMSRSGQYRTFSSGTNGTLSARRWLV